MMMMFCFGKPKTGKAQLRVALVLGALCFLMPCVCAGKKWRTLWGTTYDEEFNRATQKPAGSAASGVKKSPSPASTKRPVPDSARGPSTKGVTRSPNGEKEGPTKNSVESTRDPPPPKALPHDFRRRRRRGPRAKAVRPNSTTAAWLLAERRRKTSAQRQYERQQRHDAQTRRIY